MKTIAQFSRARRPYRRVGRAAVGVVLASTLLATGGCAMFGAGEVPTSRVLQSVDVDLAPGGEIRTMAGTAVYVDDATGASRSETSDFTVSEVVDDLPVRVTTHYRTTDGSGSDLSELAGYNGRVEIELTLENLLVDSENVAYDVVGESRTSPALVGTPLTIAASASIPQVSPSLVVFDADAERRTSGVVSADGEGGSVVQWAALLAPPQSEATTTFRLVADVKDFVIPEFDIAVQAGIHTDMSFTGVMASAFGTDSGSELATQQQAITLVADVNDVLTRAGATITEVRKNLNDTSDTLGVRASQRLNDSSKQLTAEMTALVSQISSLDSSVKGSLTGANSAMSSELTKIVGTMNAMLGDTNATPPNLLDGTGCKVRMKKNEGDGTVFSQFLYLSALLDGYASASEGCRDEILTELDTVIGPEVPDDTTCVSADTVSATCALFQSKKSLATTLGDLVLAGEAIVDDLSTATVEDGIAEHTELTATLASIETTLAALESDTSDSEQWTALLEHVTAAQTQAASLGDLRGDLIAARDELVVGGSTFEQQELIAEMLCDLGASGGATDLAQLEAVRAQIVETQCDGTTPQPVATNPSGGTSLVKMAAIATSLEAAITALDATSSTSAISMLNAELASLQGQIQGNIDSIENGASNPQSSVAELQALLAVATESHEIVGAKLTDSLAEQQALGAQITDAFAQAKADGETSMGASIDTQIEGLNKQRTVSRAKLSKSYQSLIAGLRSSSLTSLEDGRVVVEEQQSKLEAGKGKTTEALDARTTAAVESIERGTSAATRDVSAASLLLNDSLNKVLLDLGDPKIEGSGILGAMSASAAKSDTADYQLAQASQHATGYANVREEDIEGVLLRNAQFRTSLEKSAVLPPFHLEVPAGATAQTIYAFSLGGDAK